MEFIKKNKNYIIWAGCAIIAISLFTAFVKVSAFGHSESVKFIDLAKEFNKGSDGKVITAYVVLIAAIASAVLVYLKKEKISLATTGVALIVTFFDYFKVKDSMHGATALVKVSYVAPWIVLIGVILAAGPIIIDIVKKEK